MVSQLVAAAVVGALSPVAALAAIALLSSPRPVASTLGCLLGWTLVLVLLGAALLALLGGHESTTGQSAKAAVSIVVGLVLLAAALRSLVGGEHPATGPVTPGDAPDSTPGWMRKIDTITPAKAVVLGAVLIAVSPADVAVYVSAIQALLGSDLGDGAQVVVFVVLLVCIGSCIGIPLGIYLLMPKRAERLLQTGRAWLVGHQRAVTGLASAIFGVVLIAQGLGSMPS